MDLRLNDYPKVVQSLRIAYRSTSLHGEWVLRESAQVLTRFERNYLKKIGCFAIFSENCSKKKCVSN